MKNKPGIFQIRLAILICFFAGIFTNLNCQVKVAPTMFGMSAWVIDLQNPAILAGVHGKWKLVKESGVRYVRIGGIDPNFRPGYSWSNIGPLTIGTNDYLNLKEVIDSIRAFGMEPIVEVGYNPVCTGTISTLSSLSRDQQATVAGLLVERMNITDGLNIKYWIIANEPDLYKQCGPNPEDLRGYGYSTANHADTIARYVRKYGLRMKEKDPSITIIGPEIAQWGNDTLGNSVSQLMNRLVSNPNDSASIMGAISGGPANGKFYIDILSYHFYPQGITNHSGVIDAPGKNQNGFKGGLSYSSGQWKSLIKMITNNNTGRSIQNLKLACTEFNLEVSGTQPNEITNYPKTIKGYDSRSFVGGQFWADVFSHAMTTYSYNPTTLRNESWVALMCPWSVSEGDSTKSLGYLSSFTNVKSRPAYHHYKLLAEHIREVVYMNTSIAPSNPKIKAFASVESPYGIKVMIMNQDTTTDYDFRVNFSGTNTANSFGTHSLTLNFDFATDTFFSNHPGRLITDNYKSKIHTNPDSANPLRRASTIVLWLTCEGTLFHRTDYTQEDAIADEPPEITQLGNNVVNPHMISCSMLPNGIGGTINTNLSLSNQVVPVTSDLFLAPGISLTLDRCLVVMGEGTKIEGTRANHININNCVMVGCQGLTWEGIRHKGVWGAGTESFKMDSTIVVNADTAVFCHRIPIISITKNWLANGYTAINLSESKGFTVNENNIGAYETAISTQNSFGDYHSTIYGNKIIISDYSLKFDADNHNDLDITCNKLEFRQIGIKSDNTILKNQGTAGIGTGNTFRKTLWPDPTDYLIQTGGNNPTYYYGPGEASMFPYTSVMNITNTQAGGNNDCSVITETVGCKNWPVGIKEEKDLNKNLMKVYPNPSTGAFTIELETPRGVYQLAVYDMMGRLVSQRDVDFNSERTVKFDIKTKGLYIVTLQNGNSRTTQKVVVE